MIVAITGHRPDKLGGWYQPNPVHSFVVGSIAEALKELKPSYVITGMALGVDQWAAEVCLNLGIPYVAAIPFEGQESIWPPHAQAKYGYLMKHANAAYIISPGGFEPKKMQIRNEWMVGECNALLAVWDGSMGGTANCVGYAQSIGKPIKFVQIPHDIRQLALSLRPKKHIQSPVQITVPEEQKKTLLSSFLEKIQGKAEEEAKKQLLEAMEMAKKQEEWNLQKQKEKQLNVFKKLMQTSKEPKEEASEIKNVRVMDIDD